MPRSYGEGSIEKGRACAEPWPLAWLKPLRYHEEDTPAFSSMARRIDSLIRFDQGDF